MWVQVIQYLVCKFDLLKQQYIGLLEDMSYVLFMFGSNNY